MRIACVLAVVAPALCAGASLADEAVSVGASRPNIVYVFADDMGWGTGQFNNANSPVETPHLNQLASDGLNFTRHYSATVCSPSRAMLMTGFHTGNTSNDRNGNIGAGLRDEEVTVAESLSAAGYSTSVFGKWGWGGSGGSTVLRPNPVVNLPDTLPQNQGFETFYGYLNHGRAHSYQVDSLWTTTEPSDDNADGIDEVGEKYEPNEDNGLWLEKTGNNPADTAAAYTHDLIGLKSEQYIRDNAASGQPFYMQVNYTIPHFDLEAIVNTEPLRDLDGNVLYDGGLAQYAGSASMSDKERKHAAMISRMDASIGSLISRLDDPDGDGDTDDSVLDNTIVVFSSDNGPTPEDGLGVSGLNNLDLAGGLRGGKRDLFEGGIRAPLLVRWDAKIDPARRGTVDTTPTDLTDFMATTAELAGAETPVGIDGVSLAPLLTGVGPQRGGKVILSENFENSTTGNRRTDWTLIRGEEKLIKFRDGGFGLYDLATDPTESNPLDLGQPENLQRKQELEAIALAEGAGQPDNYFVRYGQWTGGGDTTRFDDAANWSLGVAPAANWSTVVNNTTGTAERTVVTDSTAVLGLEVRGDNGERTIDVAPGKTLTGRNEVRVRAGGRLELAAATLSTARWVDVAGGGKLAGQGTVDGVVYNRGTIAPGRAADLPEPGAGPQDVSELAPRDLDTGLITLVDFDFTGIQDDAPLMQASALDPNVVLAEGFNFGPATGPRNAANVGDEFNVQGFSTGNTLQSAIDGGHYLTFTLDTIDGAGILLDTVSVDLWRNGFNASENYALFTSAGGFTTDAVIGEVAFGESVFGVENTETLVGTLSTGADAITEPLEVRVYGWGSNGAAGNTHFNAASATGRVVAAPIWELDFADIQSGLPLTSVKVGSSEDIVLVEGLSLGPGLATAAESPAGSAIVIEGWSDEATLLDAQQGRDYLGFEVQSAQGLAMVLDSVTFELWRDDAAAPENFAILSSIDGFASASPASGVAQVTGVGAASRASVTALFDSAEATVDPVEFRLYGWGAGSEAGKVHLDGVSLRAQFQTIVDVALDPTGYLAIEGDLHHQSGGLIDLELDGSDSTNPFEAEHDKLIVDGTVALEGDLRLRAINGYVPSRGESFELLVAEEVVGAFASLDADAGSSELAFTLVYEEQRVVAFVTTALDGDFNADGVVDATDYALWRDSEGQQVAAYTSADGNGDGFVTIDDYTLWATNFGASLASAVGEAVPEASSVALVLVTASGSALAMSRDHEAKRRLPVRSDVATQMAEAQGR